MTDFLKIYVVIILQYQIYRKARIKSRLYYVCQCEKFEIYVAVFANS